MTVVCLYEPNVSALRKPIWWGLCAVSVCLFWLEVCIWLTGTCGCTCLLIVVMMLVTQVILSLLTRDTDRTPINICHVIFYEGDEHEPCMHRWHLLYYTQINKQKSRVGYRDSRYCKTIRGGKMLPALFCHEVCEEIYCEEELTPSARRSPAGQLCPVTGGQLWHLGVDCLNCDVLLWCLVEKRGPLHWHDDCKGTCTSCRF